MSFIQSTKTNYFPSSLRQSTKLPGWVRSNGPYVWANDGVRYLDCTSGFGVSLFGHSHPKIAEAISEQLKTLSHAISSIYPHVYEHDALYGIAKHSPINDPSIVLTSSGSEAVEVALKIAYLATGNPIVAFLDGAYHGQSLGVLRVNGQVSLRTPLEDVIGNNSFCIPFPSPVNLYGKSDYIEGCISLRDKPGAIIVEPMQNPAGYRLLPKDFCIQLSNYCKKNNVLLISDEIFTGFGRSGFWSLSQEIGLDADIYCFGKAITGGVPAGLCLGAKELFSTLATNSGIPLHSPTFLGSPIICSAIKSAVKVLEYEDIPKRSMEVGGNIRDVLACELKDSPIIAEIRGIGCAIAIQFVNTAPNYSGSTIALMAVEKLRTHRIFALNSGFPAGDVLSITPPAIIDEKEVSLIISSVLAVHFELLKEVKGEYYG